MTAAGVRITWSDLPDHVRQGVQDLLGTDDDGDRTALVLEDVEGRHPATPWDGEELAAVLSALDSLAAAALPPTLEHLPALEQDMAEDPGGSSRSADDGLALGRPRRALAGHARPPHRRPSAARPSRRRNSEVTT